MAGSSINGTEASEHTSTVTVKDVFQDQQNGAPAQHSSSNGVSKGPSSQQAQAETPYQHPMSLDDVRESPIASFNAFGTAAAMTADVPLQFRKRAHEMVDFVCDYNNKVDELPVRSSVEVGSTHESRCPDSTEPPICPKSIQPIDFAWLCPQQVSMPLIAVNKVWLYLLCSQATCMSSYRHRRQQLVSLGATS